MFTLITPLKYFRFSRIAVERKFGVTIRSNPFFVEHYAFAVELEAALRDEVYSTHIVEEQLNRIIQGDELSTFSHTYPSFTFECSDGELTLPYAKETIARHSLLVRNYIDDYPDADRIDMINHTKDAVCDAISTCLGSYFRDPLNQEVLYALQTLTPPTDLYYFLFTLPSTFPSSLLLSTLRGMTSEERETMKRVHHLYALNDLDTLEEDECPNSNYRDLPDEGRDDAIGYAFSSVRDYLRIVRVPELHDRYPSYTFYEMVNYGCHDLHETSDSLMLFMKDFSDDSGILSKDSRIFLIEEMLNYAITWERFCIILGMLGVRHASLKNENVEALAPYQLVMEEKIIPGYVWANVRKTVATYSEAPMDEIDRIMGPYLVRRV